MVEWVEARRGVDAVVMYKLRRGISDRRAESSNALPSFVLHEFICEIASSESVIKAGA